MLRNCSDKEICRSAKGAKFVGATGGRPSTRIRRTTNLRKARNVDSRKAKRIHERKKT
jgi:hypothetical protein